MSQNQHLDLDGLQELLWAFASHRVITVAGRTGVLGRLARESVTPDQLARELDLDFEATGKLIRALVALGLVEQVAGGHRLVGGIAPLFAEGPGDLSDFLEHAHDMYDAWGESLEPWLRGQPWPTRERTEEGTRRFGAAMRAMGAQVAARFAAAVELAGVRRVLDVGGGFGHYARALCAVQAELEVRVLDVPEVVAVAEHARPDSGLEDRIAFVAGDYLRGEYGSGFDLVLLANVLHQEQPEQAALILRCGAEALAPGGRVAVLDFRIDDDRHGPLVGALFAINMRSFGDTHTEPALRRFMDAAGLVGITRTDLGRHRWIIEGRKAESLAGGAG